MPEVPANISITKATTQSSFWAWLMLAINSSGMTLLLLGEVLTAKSSSTVISGRRLKRAALASPMKSLIDSRLKVNYFTLADNTLPLRSWLMKLWLMKQILCAAIHYAAGA